MPSPRRVEDVTEDIYASLGIRTVINASATLTRLGGSILNETVARAMHDASQAYVDLAELHRVIGRKVAAMTHNEGAMITSGTAAGLYLVCAGLLKMQNPEAFARMPVVSPSEERVVVHAAHHMPFLYNCSVQQFGVKLKVVGMLGRRVEEKAAEIEKEMEAAKKPLAVLYVDAGPWIPEGAPTFEAYCQVCAKYRVPLIVDAAAKLPPAENLWAYTRKGASVALFSGGKDLCGPSSAGLMLGTKAITDACREIASPAFGIGRMFKVDKEELVGMYVAVREYLGMNHEKRSAWCEEQIQQLITGMAGTAGVEITRSFPNEAGQNVPRARIEYDLRRFAHTPDQLAEILEKGDPSIALLPGELREKGVIYFNPMTLQQGQTERVVGRLREIFRTSP